MAARSLRAHLLRLLLPPIAALLAVGAVVAYYPSLEPATQAYDQALVDIGLAIGSQVRVTETQYRFELPQAVDQVLRTDHFDRIFYRITSNRFSVAAIFRTTSRHRYTSFRSPIFTTTTISSSSTIW